MSGSIWKMSRATLLLAATIGFLAGCTPLDFAPTYAAVRVDYVPDSTFSPEKINPADYTIAIAEFTDDREFVDADDPESKSFVTGYYGLTYKGEEFRPVTEIVQDLLVSEFQQVGYQAILFDEDADYDYLLAGKILDFRYYSAGLISTKYIWTVIFELDLFDDVGNELFDRLIVEDIDEEKKSSSMPDNIVTLIDKNFRDAAGQTTKAVSEAIGENMKPFPPQTGQ